MTLPRVAYAGTAPFALSVLRGLVAAAGTPVAVITNPDRPKGRHGTPQPPDIKLVAQELGLPVLQPERLSTADGVATLLEQHPDVLVACAYGQILGDAVLGALPAIVVHPSLVPRWRGAAPVERALMAGETELGVTVVRMTAGVDEGPVAETRLVHVPRDADAGAAYALLAPAAVDALLATLSRMADGSVEWAPQTGEPTYAPKIEPAERVIDFSRTAAEISDQVRALSPHIGAVTEILGRRTRIWTARPGQGPRPEPSRDRLTLAAGDGWIEVLELQQEGRTRMPAAEFLRGAGRSLAAP